MTRKQKIARKAAMLDYLEEITSSMSGTREPIAPAEVQTPAFTPDNSISPQKRDLVEFVERQSSFKLKGVNKRPAVAGFCICPEHEKAIRVLASVNPSLNNNKGKALEYLVEFYIGSLPDEMREEFLSLMAGALKR